MIEMGVSQAQANFTKLFDKIVAIVDKKSKKKKAVILPYDEYMKLLTKAQKDSLDDGDFSKFVGILDKDFKSNDRRYQEIIK